MVCEAKCVSQAYGVEVYGLDGRYCLQGSIVKRILLEDVTTLT